MIEATLEETGLEAIERLFHESSEQVWRALYAFAGGDAHVADDALAEAFARAIQYRKGIRDPLRWIYRTAFRLAARELRRRRRDDVLGTQADRSTTPGLDELMDLLRLLSPSQRAAVTLHYYLDLPVKEVASRLGTSTATAKVHLHRARRRLRELLGPEGAIDD